MTRKGEAELALGAGVWFSAVGGIAGTLSLMILRRRSPRSRCRSRLSNISAGVPRPDVRHAGRALLAGEGHRRHVHRLLVSCIGIENPAACPASRRHNRPVRGIEPIPALVGVFAVAQVMRAMLTPEPPPIPRRKFGSIMAGQWR